jgi:hypothetical protein
MEKIEQFRSSADWLIQNMRPVSLMDFGYTRDSVKWLEGYIERLRLSGQFNDAASRDNMIGVFGSFLGECIIQSYGGSWEQRDEGWRIEFKPGSYVLPFAKVSKQMSIGLEDGIGWLFDSIPEVFLGIGPSSSN